MSSTFTALDLSQLPPPEVVEGLSFETILAEMTADLKARDPAFDALVESDPAMKILEVAAYRELLLRQRVNDAARGVMLAYAAGADLDHLGALFGVKRLTGTKYHDKVVISGVLNPMINGVLLRGEDDSFYGAPTYSTDGGRFPPPTGLWVALHLDGVWRILIAQDGLVLDAGYYSASFYEGDPPLSPHGIDWSTGGGLGGATGVPITTVEAGATEYYTESDTDYRRRIQLALEGFSVAGPEGAYIFWGLSASADVLDISATSPAPGQVLITVLSRHGTGQAGGGLLSEVLFHLNDDTIRPLTDELTVQSAEIVFFDVVAQIHTYPGPDSSLILERAKAALDAYLESVHRIGRNVSISGIYAALHQPGVQRVNLMEPTADLVIDATQASCVSTKTLTIAGTDE